MKGKIRISEKQLKFLQEQRLNNDYFMDQEGQLQQGEMEVPDPHEMAEKVINDMRLHSSYMQDEDSARQFAEAFYEVINEKISSGEFFNIKRPNRLKISEPQLNENIDIIQNEFKRFL